MYLYHQAQLKILRALCVHCSVFKKKSAPICEICGSCIHIVKRNSKSSAHSACISLCTLCLKLKPSISHHQSSVAEGCEIAVVCYNYKGVAKLISHINKELMQQCCIGRI